MRSLGSPVLFAIALAVADWSLVLGRSSQVRSWSQVRPWSVVPGPADIVQGQRITDDGPRTTDQARTTDQGRTKDQEPTKDEGPSTRDPSEAPWFGTWQQVPPPQKWFNPWPYQKVTLRIEPWDDGLRVVYDMVRRRGGITHMEWSGRFDGRDYPVQGVDYVLTNAYRKISDRSYEIVVRVDGREAAVATAVVSADGSTMIVDTRERTQTGPDINTTASYRRR